MPLGINSRLSIIECPSGSGPKAHGLGCAGDALGYQKNKIKNIVVFMTSPTLHNHAGGS